MRFLVLNSILVRGVAIVASDDLLTRRCPLEAVLGGSLLTPITMVMYTIFLVVPRRRYNLARLLHRAQMQSLVPARVQHDLLIAHLLFTFLLRDMELYYQWNYFAANYLKQELVNHCTIC